MEVEAEFLTDRGAILKELMHSKTSQNAVGIACEKLGSGMFITVVDDIIIADDATIIVLRPFDANGRFFPTNRITLDEITSLFPFMSEFINPFLEQSKPTEIIDNVSWSFNKVNSHSLSGRV